MERTEERNTSEVEEKLLTSEEEEKLEKNLVWIFGSVRSGTTWLGTELLNFKDNIIWAEPYIGFHLMVLKKHRTRDDYFFSNKFKNLWKPILRKLILNRAFSRSRSLDNLMIIKEPNGIGGADTIMECLPNSKLIFLLRDGRDVIDSLIDSHSKDSWNNGLEPFSSEAEKLNQIKKYSKGWIRGMNLMLQVFENHSSNLRLLIKYEDLLKNTRNELKKIIDFLDSDISEEEIAEIVTKYDFKNIPMEKKGSGKFTRSANPGQWKLNLTGEEKDAMQEIMKETLIKLGYEI